MIDESGSFKLAKVQDGIPQFVREVLAINPNDEIFWGIRGTGNNKYAIMFKKEYNTFLYVFADSIDRKELLEQPFAVS